MFDIAILFAVVSLATTVSIVGVRLGFAKARQMEARNPTGHQWALEDLAARAKPKPKPKPKDTARAKPKPKARAKPKDKPKAAPEAAPEAVRWPTFPKTWDGFADWLLEVVSLGPPPMKARPWATLAKRTKYEMGLVIRTFAAEMAQRGEALTNWRDLAHRWDYNPTHRNRMRGMLRRYVAAHKAASET